VLARTQDKEVTVFSLPIHVFVDKGNHASIKYFLLTSQRGVSVVESEGSVLTHIELWLVWDKGDIVLAVMLLF
jgi:hypothetical protein